MSSIHNLVRANKLMALEQLLKSTSSVNNKSDLVDKKDHFERTPLHLASYEGKIEIIKLLLKYGANINSLAKNAMTSLHFAVQKGHLNVAILLCKNGSNINSKTHNCMTPLHLALKNGHVNCAVFLIQKGHNLVLLASTVGLADSSFNYLPLKGNATPRDRGGSIVIGPQVEPVADLREAKGDVIRKAVCKTNGRGARQYYNKRGELPLDLASEDVRLELEEKLGEGYEKFKLEIIGEKVRVKETVQFYKKRRVK